MLLLLLAKMELSIRESYKLHIQKTEGSTSRVMKSGSSKLLEKLDGVFLPTLSASGNSIDESNLEQDETPVNKNASTAEEKEQSGEENLNELKSKDKTNTQTIPSTIQNQNLSFLLSSTSSRCESLESSYQKIFKTWTKVKCYSRIYHKFPSQAKIF